MKDVLRLRFCRKASRRLERFFCVCGIVVKDRSNAPRLMTRQLLVSTWRSIHCFIP